MQDKLSSSIESIRGVGPKLAKALAKKGIATLEDALYFLPRAYEDRRHVTPISALGPGTSAAVFGTVSHFRMIRQGRKNRFEVTLKDKSGSLRLVWFHAFPSLASEFSEGSRFIVYGRVEFFGGLPSMTHPEYEKVAELSEGRLPVSYHFGRIVPIYSETEGLKQKSLRKIVAEVLKASLNHLDEPLPSDLRDRLKLTSLRESFIGVHYPKDFPNEELPPSQPLRRIVFEEFFILQLGLGLKKRKLKSQKSPLLINQGILERFIAGLPFSLTEDQKKAIEEIRSDLARSETMARLIQGDVGSGKTVIALAAAAIAAEHRFQTAIMAPTEILAHQHFAAAERWLAPLGIKSALLVGERGPRKEAQKLIDGENALVIVGTHALFQQAAHFRRLGLVVVDEQHRFGVEQRSELVKKGKEITPHLLMMTATPIPRTLALTLYGDLDLTLIRQKPAGRKPVRTLIVRDKDRHRLYQMIRETVDRGEQVYLIYPLVEASEKLDLKSATEMHQRLKKEIFPDLSIALLHGRMKSEEKEAILLSFKKGEPQLLVSTTVIEVGIDVPNATLMIIEHPERLGLSQLHQLRGRVGRGEKASVCALVADSHVGKRLRVMERTEDGFEIAEEDLKIRGPGEFLGIRQSGLPGFRVGHIIRDSDLLSLAREEAKRILDSDPTLHREEHEPIRRLVETRWKEKIERLTTG